MKKIIFVITIAIAAFCSFTGCEKEDGLNSSHSLACTLPIFNDNVIEYSDYVSLLEQFTGFDIHKLATLPEAIKSAEMQQKLCNAICIDNEKNDISETELQLIIQYGNLMRGAVDAGNESLAWLYFDTLCQVSTLLDEYMIENGFEEYYIPQSEVTIHIPSQYMQNEFEQGLSLQNAISAQYPSFNDLSQVEKQEVVRAVVCTAYENQLNDKTQSLTCEQRAQLMFVGECAWASAKYVAEAALCSGTTFVVALCEAAAFTSYMINISQAKAAYDNRLKLC